MKRHFNFTIVEVLLVISILLILLSLLSPSLQKMTRHAREVDCSKGIRNLVMVSHIYAEDHHGFFPDIQRNPSSQQVIPIAFFAFRYWAGYLEKDYGLNIQTWYSPSNPHWTHDMFYQYNGGTHMVMGRAYYGARSLKNTLETRILTSFKGSPTFASNHHIAPQQKVLWTDLNRKLNGTNSFINPVAGGIKNGANHLYDLSGNWPSLSHNGLIDGSVQTALARRHSSQIQTRQLRPSLVTKPL